MEFVVVSLLNGIVYGLLLFMVSAGLTLIFGMMGILNMAHASFYMIGAYTGYAVSLYHYPFVAGVLLATLVAGGRAQLISAVSSGSGSWSPFCAPSSPDVCSGGGLSIATAISIRGLPPRAAPFNRRTSDAECSNS